MGALVRPTAPMVGCLGVAPAHEQAISTRICSGHCGNMGYHGFCDGATIYLPVFVAGALIHLGNGHVWQEQGEIVGTGIEIALDVEFPVKLRTVKSICCPRDENDGHVFTSEMLVRWIRRLRPQPRKCLAGFRKTLNWTPWEYTVCSAIALNKSWRSSTIRRSQWYANFQRAESHAPRATAREAGGNR